MFSTFYEKDGSQRAKRRVPTERVEGCKGTLAITIAWACHSTCGATVIVFAFFGLNEDMPMSDAIATLERNKTIILETFDATALLKAPFTVILKNSAKQVVDGEGKVIEIIIPDPEGLVRAVAQARVLHEHKLNAADLKFLRLALGLKSKELADVISVTPEHVSRLEAGDKVLSPQSEKLVRIYTFVSTVPFTKRKLEEAVSIVAKVFGKLSIAPCHLIDETIVFRFERIAIATPAGDPGCDDGVDGLWDEPSEPVAA